MNQKYHTPIELHTSRIKQIDSMLKCLFTVKRDDDEDAEDDA